MKKIWIEQTDKRIELNKLQKRLSILNARIEKLEQSNDSQDTVQAVFNGLLDYIGLGEYFLDENKRLNIRLSKNYDISNEGRRISSAQRKILSLCYFFADIVSEVTQLQLDFHWYYIPITIYG